MSKTGSERIIGYTAGVYDLFHIGHLYLLKNAKSMCDHLIVGVSTDELVMRTKGKQPVIKFAERLEIVSAIKYVDTVVRQDSLNKLEAWDYFKFNLIFVGSDWKGKASWVEMEEKFSSLNVRVIYFPYTLNTSSTKINCILDQYRTDIDD